jgi:hypothetical protein
MKAILSVCALCVCSLLAVAQQHDELSGDPNNGTGTLNTSQASTGSSSCQVLAADDPQMGPLAKLCELSRSFHAHLPDFICTQTTVITAQRTTKIQTVEAQITYLHGKEQYSDIRVDGKPPASDRVVWLTHPLLSTRGEFGSDLVYLFTPPIAAEFKLKQQTTFRSQAVLVYEFHLPAEKNTFWTLYDVKNQSVRPELRGELWIEQQQAKLMRLRLEPANLPLDFGIKNGSTMINYADVKLGEAGIFLLPASSETDACLRGYNLNLLAPTLTCLHNVVTFRDCHKFTAKARITGVYPPANQ